jgi:hypothetical protein
MNLQCPPPPPPPPGKKALEMADLPNDILGEILLRLPADEPVHLIRASAVCKAWFGTVADRVFQRAYRAFQGAPVLGFLTSAREERRDFTRFIPSSPARFTPSTTELDDMDAVDSRHGRVLLHTFLSDVLEDGFVVWDPRTEERWELRRPPWRFDSWSATLACGVVSCDHLDSKCSESFEVVFLGSDTRAGRTFACHYSPAIGAWSQLAAMDNAVILNLRPPAFVENTMFFTTRSGNSVRYHVPSSSLSTMDPPEMELPFRDFLLLGAAGGRLRLATISMSSVHMWERKIQTSKGTTDTPWRHLDQIGLWIENPRHPIQPGVPGTVPVGFAEGHLLVYFTAGEGLSSVNLESGVVSRVLDNGEFETITPYLSFHLVGMSVSIINYMRCHIS